MKEGYGNWVFPWGGFSIEQVGFVFFVSTGKKGPKDAGCITRRKGLKTLEREGKLMVQHIFDRSHVVTILRVSNLWLTCAMINPNPQKSEGSNYFASCATLSNLCLFIPY